jgi:hypothetical protein
MNDICEKYIKKVIISTFIAINNIIMEFRGVSLSSKIYDDITKLIRKSYPNACLLYIDEIINDNLLSNYHQRKTNTEQRRGKENVRELMLFHGTKVECINNIATNGFMKQFNKVSAYGKGTYFSTKASYSSHYTDKDNTDVSYMYICDVIVCKCTVVNGPHEIDTTLYDNSVNNLESPDIYVTPYDDAAYPRYLVAYHKNAK